MKQSLRKTPSHLRLVYAHGEATDSLLGRHFTLDIEGSQLTLGIDLSPNFHTRKKSAPAFLDAVSLVHHHRLLRSVQCSDNLVRARLIKAWERVPLPRLRMCLDLGERGRFMYAVLPHSLFMGGIELDVREFIDPTPPAAPHAYRSFSTSRIHA